MKTAIYHAKTEYDEDCCPKCKGVIYDPSGWLKIEDTEYPVYYCPDCDLYYIADFDK
jgi:Zn-finger nucleic acid-binding protein